jgi:hypothetical protein
LEDLVKILTVNTDMNVVKRTLLLKMATNYVNLVDKKPTVNPNSKNTPPPNLILLLCLLRSESAKKRIFKVRYN